ncbi:AsmA family protein [Coxiella-like endosymbiont]|uniref:AsmA family protein n=1 Tax=Coxiella-like endosymbiont TaxID=1592897 RepID=UPI0034E1D9A5
MGSIPITRSLLNGRKVIHNSFKILAGILTVIIAVFVISIIILIKVVNPNNYKNCIDQFVHNETSRHLILKGNMGWSFIPSR